MTNLREAVARAIWRANLLDAAVTPDEDGDGYVFFANEAAAAIAAVLDAMGEPTHAMKRAALESVAVDDEGAFPSMLDMLDYSGENKAHTVIRAALKAAVAAFREDALQDVEGRK